MSEREHANPVTVFAGNIVEAEFVKSLLEGASIQCFVQNETIGTVAPFLSPGGLGAVQILVRASDAEKAQAIVDDYQNSSTTPD
jgi:hypothetical protein